MKHYFGNTGRVCVRYNLIVGTRSPAEVEVVDIAKPRQRDEVAAEAWERMTEGGLKIEWYSRAEYQQWLAEAKTFLRAWGEHATR